MRRSTDRILATHGGALPRPDDVKEPLPAGAVLLPGVVGHPKIAWAKLQTIAEGARIASRRLWSTAT